MKSINQQTILLKKTFLEKILIKLYNFRLVTTLQNLTVSNRIGLSIPKHINCRDASNIKEELFEAFNRLTQAFFVEINSLKSDILTTDAPTDKNSSHISSFRKEIEYLREGSWAKTMIKKQLTEIKTTANPTSTLVTYNDHSIDKTTQNNNKEL